MICCGNVSFQFERGKSASAMLVDKLPSTKSAVTFQESSQISNSKLKSSESYG